MRSTSTPKQTIQTTFQKFVVLIFIFVFLFQYRHFYKSTIFVFCWKEEREREREKGIREQRGKERGEREEREREERKREKEIKERERREGEKEREKREKRKKEKKNLWSQKSCDSGPPCLTIAISAKSVSTSILWLKTSLCFSISEISFWESERMWGEEKGKSAKRKVV